MIRSVFFTLLVSFFAVSTSMGETTYFTFTGLQGNGLLPGNGQPADGMANAKDSSATGGEINPKSLYFDSETSTFFFDFQFQDLSSGGLFLPAVHGGIHIHGPTTAADPYSNKGVLYKLNTTLKDQPGLKLTSGTLAEGVRDGRLTGSVVIDAKDVDALLQGLTYINIHSGKYNAGEIRGNLVPAKK